MTLPLDNLGGIRDPNIRRNFEIIAQQFPIIVTGGGGGGAPSGPAGGVLAGTYPNPGFAADMATQVELDAHTTLTTTAHGGIVASTDSRLTDARTPTAHHATHEPGGTDAMAVDAAAGTGSLRTLGTGALQATAGNDSRLSNARTPTAHQTSHQSGGSDALTGNLDATARSNILKAGTLIGTRRGLNLIQGTNVTLTMADDAANERVNVTVDAAAGGGGSSIGVIQAYAEFTANVTISATTQATANTVVTAPAFTADGTSSYWFDFFSIEVLPGASGTVVVDLFDGSTAVCQLAVVATGTGASPPTFARRRLTPTAGSHTYSMRAHRLTANGTIAAGNGTAGANAPGFICVTQAS